MEQSHSVQLGNQNNDDVLCLYGKKIIISYYIVLSMHYLL